MGFDWLGKRAKAELEAEKASHARIDASRQEEIKRLSGLLQSTVMKLIALTDRDAYRIIEHTENPPVQKGLPSTAFMRRGNLQSALRKSVEAAKNGVSVPE